MDLAVIDLLYEPGPFFSVVHSNVMPHCGSLDGLHNVHLHEQPVCICQMPKTNLDYILFKISQTIDETRTRATTSDHQEQSSLEWKRVSLVVDRFLLILVTCVSKHGSFLGSVPLLSLIYFRVLLHNFFADVWI